MAWCRCTRVTFLSPMYVILVLNITLLTECINVEMTCSLQFCIVRLYESD